MTPPPRPPFDSALLDTAVALALSIELRDQAAGGHSFRTTTYALLLAESAGLPPGDVELLRVGTPLHDIGIIGIPDAILRKPGRLTAAEFEAMKAHVVKGAEVLASVTGLGPLLPIVRSHHERWDGRGYPDGLAGEAIPVLARVVALAEAFDAITSPRPYRRARPASAAFVEIRQHAGSQFDPGLASALLSHASVFEEAARQHAPVR